MARTIHQGELDRDDVRQLLASHVAAMHVHSPPEACHVLPADRLHDPAITFFSVRDEGRLLAIGALKALGNGTGEIKSMRTHAEALRQGAASTILRAIVAEARSRGYSRLLLETGSGPEFAAATLLYERAGFTRCEPFGGYLPGPFTRFMSLDL
ncbi:GNAT family N-acetyltransferase [Sphingomonas sp. BN140010]|uniref:GNAT family N-acetyltransferase n=1 Tax=Sphingomonas arvum TaxID=2992113 RepID=A0ABT3JED5_9SPHN|nr:GNAT family N-acetyltransferase [Sphingomonas sp. BN140010]MCW3797423.1 GNAT family N-acetyltransferase [Sphingomonas sp. BN140010]